MALSSRRLSFNQYTDLGRHTALGGQSIKSVLKTILLKKVYRMMVDSYRITKAIQWRKKDYTNTIRVENHAQIAWMR
nr:hypothetical protein [uncultured Desulfobacter sp.]